MWVWKIVPNILQCKYIYTPDMHRDSNYAQGRDKAW